MTLLDLHWRFTASDYERMAAVGILSKDQGTELREGQVMDIQPSRPHRFTASDFLKMAEIGVLQEDDPVELIEGEIVEMAPIGSRHFAAVNRLNRALVTQVGTRGVVSIQNPVLLNNLTMPEPDVVVFAPSPDDYQGALPGADKVLLVAEVADSSLQYDLRRKLPLYAADGIPEYWLVDLVRARIEIFRKPEGPSFQEHLTLRGADEASPLALPDVKLRVADIIGS